MLRVSHIVYHSLIFRMLWVHITQPEWYYPVFVQAKPALECGIMLVAFFYCHLMISALQVKF